MARLDGPSSPPRDNVARLPSTVFSEMTPRNYRHDATGEIEILEISTASELHEWKDRWNSLNNKTGLPMTTFAWVYAAAKHVVRDGDLRLILAVRPEGELIGVLPLAWKGNGWSRRLELIDPSLLYEPASILGGNVAGLKAILSLLAAEGSPLMLERTADAVAIAKIARNTVPRCIAITRRHVSAPTLRLHTGWVDPASQLSKRRRGDLRRGYRRAHQMGASRSEIRIVDPEEVTSLMDLLIDVETRSWKGRAGTALASDHIRQRFYREFAAIAASDGFLRISSLRINDQTAAVQLATEIRGTFCLLKIAYDERFAKCSPGQLLVAETIAWASNNGCQRYEFLGVMQPWIKMWTDDVTAYSSIYLYPMHPIGGLALARDVCGWLKRRLTTIVRIDRWIRKKRNAHVASKS